MSVGTNVGVGGTGVLVAGLDVAVAVAVAVGNGRNVTVATIALGDAEVTLTATDLVVVGSDVATGCVGAKVMAGDGCATLFVSRADDGSTGTGDGDAAFDTDARQSCQPAKPTPHTTANVSNKVKMTRNEIRPPNMRDAAFVWRRVCLLSCGKASVATFIAASSTTRIAFAS